MGGPGSIQTPKQRFTKEFRVNWWLGEAGMANNRDKLGKTSEPESIERNQDGVWILP